MAFSRVRGGFVPMLGGKPVVARSPAKKAKSAHAAVEYVHADGTPVDPGLYKDVVFVKAETEATATGARPRPRAQSERSWWSALDAAALQPADFQDARKDVVVGDVRFTGA